MLFFVRHGQTYWNKQEKYQGRKDIELNEKGIWQAQTIKDKLEGIKFDMVFSSPLKRAVKTAQIITDQQIVLDERIIERCNGDLEGKCKSECENLVDFSDPNDTRCNVEPLLEFRDRIKSFLIEITESFKNKNVLIVTHAGVSIYIRCFFEGEPADNDYDKLKLKNCEVLTYKN